MPDTSLSLSQGLGSAVIRKGIVRHVDVRTGDKVHRIFGGSGGAVAKLLKAALFSRRSGTKCCALAPGTSANGLKVTQTLIKALFMQLAFRVQNRTPTNSYPGGWKRLRLGRRFFFRTFFSTCSQGASTLSANLYHISLRSSKYFMAKSSNFSVSQSSSDRR